MTAWKIIGAVIDSDLRLQFYLQSWYKKDCFHGTKRSLEIPIFSEGHERQKSSVTHFLIGSIGR